MLEKRQRQLEYIVEEKTSEVVQQKEELQLINNELLQQKEEILSQRDTLHIANATKDKFFNIIAHDLRNPFSTIIGFSNLLVANAEAEDFKKIQKFAQIIHQSSTSAFNLLDNLLNWSRSQMGGIPFKPHDLNVKDLIDTNISLLNPAARSKGIFLTSDVSDNIIAFADKDMLLTILRNLITNAIKFSRKDDSITLEVEESTEWIIFHVSDTGIGIDEGIIGKLFKVDETIKTIGTAQEQGTGLGLILCKEFVDVHKGKIWVESKLGIGSRFSFTIPKIN